MCDQSDKNVQLPVRPRGLIDVRRKFNLLLHPIVICRLTADLEKTLEVAEKIRHKIEKEDFKYKDEIIRVTASFGICNMVPSQKQTMEEIIEIADKKLYQAKNNGRNRVEI